MRLETWLLSVLTIEKFQMAFKELMNLLKEFFELIISSELFPGIQCTQNNFPSHYNTTEMQSPKAEHLESCFIFFPK